MQKDMEVRQESLEDGKGREKCNKNNKIKSENEPKIRNVHVIYMNT